MASKFTRFTDTTQITTTPSSLERIVVGTHTGVELSVYDGTLAGIGNGVTTLVMGTFIPHATQTYGPQEIVLEAKFDNGILIQASASPMLDGTIFYNGDPLR